MNKWIVIPKSNNHSIIRLFCFPYAGSSAVVTYKFLVDNLPDQVEVCPVEFPGRGGRMSEKLVDNLDDAVESIYSEIGNYLDKPFAFFGHSMGAIVSYELARKLYINGATTPFKLFLSAHRAPQLEREGKLMHLLSSSEFLKELREMNGIAKEIIEHQELLELMLPIIKNDYQLCETYRHLNNTKLNIPFQIFGGNYDKDVDYDSLLSWGELTSEQTNIEMIKGDHFFLTKEKEKFLNSFKPLIYDDIKFYDRLNLD